MPSRAELLVTLDRGHDDAGLVDETALIVEEDPGLVVLGVRFGMPGNRVGIELGFHAATVDPMDGKAVLVVGHGEQPVAGRAHRHQDAVIVAEAVDDQARSVPAAPPERASVLALADAQAHPARVR